MTLMLSNRRDINAVPNPPKATTTVLPRTIVP
jgi:hypothetical protein